MDKARLKMGSVPVRIAARVYGRDPAWVRAGIIAGWLPIGEATRNGKRVTDGLCGCGWRDFYCSGFGAYCDKLCYLHARNYVDFGAR